MNMTILEGKWKELKGEVQTLLGELSLDDIEKSKGNLKSIAGLLEQQYGEAKEQIAAKLHDLANRLSTTDAADGVKNAVIDVKQKVESKVAEVKAEAADKTDSMKQNVRAAKNEQNQTKSTNY